MIGCAVVINITNKRKVQNQHDLTADYHDEFIRCVFECQKLKAGISVNGDMQMPKLNTSFQANFLNNKILPLSR